MIRLVRVELRRLWLRRLTKVVFGLVLLLGMGVMAVGGYNDSRPVSASEHAQAVQMSNDFNAQLTPDMIASCEKDKATQKAAGQDVTGWECGPQGPESYERHPGTRWTELNQVPMAAISLLTLATLIVTASFIGAEFSSGSLGNHLTFEPRRDRVYWSKVLALALGCVAYAFVLIGGMLLSTLAATALSHAQPGNLGGGGAHWGWTVLRAALMPALLAAMFGGLAFLLRHTAAVVGAAVVYVIGFGLLSNFWNRVSQFSLTDNLTALVTGQGSWYSNKCGTGTSGYSCETVTHYYTWHQGLVVVGVVALALAVAGWLVFRRRDVN